MNSCDRLTYVSSLVCGLLAALGLALIVTGGSAAADDWEYQPDPQARQEAYRAALRNALDRDSVATTPAEEIERLVAHAVGIAAEGCVTGGTMAEARTLIEGLAERLADSTATPEQRVEVHIAAAACALTDGASDKARASLLAASDLAHGIDDWDARDRLIAWIADVAGTSGALPADDIMIWAGDVTDARSRATIVRAWALARFVDDPDNVLGLIPAGPYAPFAEDTDDILNLAVQALADGRWLPALELVAATPTSVGDDREALLEQIYLHARSMGDFAFARMAAMAAAHPVTQRDWLAELADDALDDSLETEALLAARLMAPSREAVNIWLKIATFYRDAGYPQLVTDALDSAQAMVARVSDDEQPALLARLAGRAAQVDEVDRAAAILADVAPSEDLPKAISDLAKRLAELGRVEDALSWAAIIDEPSVDVELRSRAFGTIAKAQAEAGAIDAAAATIDSRPDLAGRYLDRGLRAITVALAEAGDVERAETYLARIEDPEERSRAEVALAELADQDGARLHLEKSILFAGEIADTEDRDARLIEIVEAILARNDASDLDAVVDGAEALVSDSVARETVLGLRLAATASITMQKEAFEALLDQIDALSEPRAVNLARSALATRLAAAGDIQRASKVNRGVRDWRLRLSNFRHFAEEQTARLDVHELIPNAPAEISHIRHEADAPPADDAGRVPMLDRAGLAAYTLPEAGYQDWPELIGFGDRLGTLRLRPDDIRAQFPVLEEGRVHRMTGLTLNYNRKFTEIEPVIGQAQAQGEPLPQIIYIEDGVVTLSMVREQMLRRGAADYISVENGVYLLRRPLVVGPNATLVVSGSDVRELRLSTLNHVYLVVAGELLVGDTTITSWDTEANGPSEIEHGVNDYDFRPFIATWSDSSMSATASIFRALGYNNRKSFGLGFSAGPHDYDKYGMILPSPDAMLVENLFERMYYGFYSRDVFTADMIGNEYRNSVIYGPDPHDYSEDIMMAYNTSYGTKVKHGLIVSREVDGIFVGNVAFDNYGAGIMLDRLSNHSVIYANTVFDNGKDGIAVYETACAIVANNASFDNYLSGVRVRNSVDVGVFDNMIEDNREAGVVLYTDDLATHVWRNLEMDPFWTIVSATIADNEIVGNGNAIRATDAFAISMADNLMVENGSRPMVGDFDPLMSSLIRLTHFGEDPLMLSESCLGPLERYATCHFRELGVFDGDGQAQWDMVGDASICASTFQLSNNGLIREASN